MFRQNKEKIIKNNQNNKKIEEKKSRYVNWWLFRKKGTVAEPWATADELWNNPEVREEIKHHNSLVEKIKRKI